MENDQSCSLDWSLLSLCTPSPAQYLIHKTNPHQKIHFFTWSFNKTDFTSFFIFLAPPKTLCVKIQVLDHFTPYWLWSKFSHFRFELEWRQQRQKHQQQSPPPAEREASFKTRKNPLIFAYQILKPPRYITYAAAAFWRYLISRTSSIGTCKYEK